MMESKLALELAEVEQVEMVQEFEKVARAAWEQVCWAT